MAVAGGGDLASACQLDRDKGRRFPACRLADLWGRECSEKMAV